MRASTIDEVIENLDGVIARARRQDSRAGYFPALYRKVTVRVKEGIRDGVFEDGERMERLDVIFASRYLEAVSAVARGEPTTRSWAVSFRAARSWWPIVLQHLLLGMNAHINLDLGIAAARTAPGAELASLENDFNTINDVLAKLVNGVKEELTAVWPRLRRLDRWPGAPRTGSSISACPRRATTLGSWRASWHRCRSKHRCPRSRPSTTGSPSSAT